MKLYLFLLNMRIRIFLLLLYFACNLQINAGASLKSGLFFQSFEVNKDKRTYLDLTPDKPLSMSKGLTMDFDLNLRMEGQSFGYVFRLIANDTLNIDLLSDVTNPDKSFSLVVGSQTLIQFKNDEIKFKEGNWISVQLRCDPSTNKIDLSLNGAGKSVQCRLEMLKRFRVYFGGNTHGIFSTTDIAPMMIKNIRMFDGGGHLVRYWKLESHAEDAAYDECEQAKATVSNPVWEIDSHTNWSKLASLVLPGAHYCMTFDPANNRIFIVKDRKIFIYRTKSRVMDTLEVRQGVPYNTEFNQLVYDPAKDELISYDFAVNRLAAFNFNTLTWSNENKAVIPPFYSHHSSYFRADTVLLITLGGYGYHRYSSLLQKYNFNTGAWESSDLSKTIAPRYLGSMGYLGENQLLYFGGFGNKSGRQEEFPKNYYDLYIVDVNSMTAQKILEYPNPAEHFTNSNSLIIDKGNRKFYALAYPNKRYASIIKLHEYSLDKPEYRVVGDSIPYFFNDVESFCNLYQSSDSSELYAITSSVKNNLSEINIYSIAFPTLSLDETIQQPPRQVNGWGWLWLLAPICLIEAFIFYRKRKRKEVIPEQVATAPIDDSDNEPVIVSNSFPEKKRRSSIRLLGNFQLIDNNGSEITKSFTPTTTQLFLLLLLSTVKNGQGISSQELKNILWFDKDDESARNNRNVYINKLRSILKPFREIIIVNEGGYWRIQLEKTVFCDYERALLLINSLKTVHPFNKKLLAELADIALNGTLLPLIQQAEWLDPYQSDYANQLIECLMKHSKHEEVKTDLLLLLKIGDVILLHDNTDEDGIRFKCYALFHLGRKKQALQVFNKFIVDYENLLAIKPNLIFEELVK